MNKIIASSAIALLLASAAAPAIAQDASAGVGAGVDAGVSVDTPAAGVDAGVNAGASGNVDASKDGATGNAAASASGNANANAQANAGGMSDNTYGSVISSIKGSADVDLSGITSEDDVQIVLLSSLQGDAATESEALDAALSADAEAHTMLETNIDGNEVIKAKLEAEGYSAADVVAVKSEADGTVIVYVDDRAE